MTLYKSKFQVSKPKVEENTYMTENYRILKKCMYSTIKKLAFPAYMIDLQLRVPQ